MFLLVGTSYCFVSNDFVDMIFGLTLAVNVLIHSLIGINYVITDYVLTVIKALAGPARLFSAGLVLVTIVGLDKITMNGQGVIKSTILTLWRGDDVINMELTRLEKSKNSYATSYL